MSETYELFRALLGQLGDHVRDSIASRTQLRLSGISRVALSDVIYEVDAMSEEWILEWLDDHWPCEHPIELLMEGLDEMICFPKQISRTKTRWKLIIDPVDGTRGLMFDKRPAWFMAAIAPQRFVDNRLADIVVASMTELPVTKQWRADQLSAIRGLGKSGVVGSSFDVKNGTRAPFQVALSEADDFLHGFSGLAKFFPAGRVHTAEIERQLWTTIYPTEPAPAIFDDQYISCGGQFYELLAGKDRMSGDIRPIANQFIFGKPYQAAHPYDVCTSLILTESGAIFEHPMGGPVDVPLDTLSSVSWIAFANQTLADRVRPILPRLIEKVLS